MTTNDSIPTRFPLRKLFRLQAGLAGVAAVAGYVFMLGPGLLGDRISIVDYVLSTVVAACGGYCLGRLYFGRFTAVLMSMAFTAIASCSFTRPKMDHPRDFAILGMVIATSLFIAFGWLDSLRNPLARVHGIDTNARTVRERNKLSENA